MGKQAGPPNPNTITLHDISFKVGVPLFITEVVSRTAMHSHRLHCWSGTWRKAFSPCAHQHR